LSAPPDPLAAIGGGCLLLREKEGKEMGKGKEGDGNGEGRKGKERRERADPRPGLRKCKGGNPKVWRVRQLCLRRIGVRGQKSLKTAELNQSAYSPILAPSDHFLIRNLKYHLRGTWFIVDESLKIAIKA